MRCLQSLFITKNKCEASGLQAIPMCHSGPHAVEPDGAGGRPITEQRDYMS